MILKKISLMLAVGFLLTLSGGLIFVYGMQNAGWDFKKLDREELTAAEFSTQAQITSVHLQAGSWKYEVVAGDAFEIQYFTSNLCTLEVVEQNGEIYFNERDLNWLNYVVGFHGIVRAGVKVVITIPNDIALYARGSSVSVVAKNSADSTSRVGFLSVDIRGSSADLELENVDVAGFVSIKGSSADFEMKNGNVGAHITMDGSSADLELENVTVSKGITLFGSSAESSMKAVTCSAITLKGSSAKLELKNATVQGQLFADGSSVKVEIEDSSVKGIDAIGSSARINAKRADIGGLEAEGSSVNVTLNLVGSEADLQRAQASGSSAKVYVSGQKGNFNGAGHKEFRVHGSSANLTLTFAGGKSQFGE